MNKLQASYRILESFAYPATLGAALAWWIQALAVAIDGGTPRPTYWALGFGLWFIAYHSIWYCFLITATKVSDIPKDYGHLSVGTDFFDIAAMMMGFVGLGFAAGHYDKTHAGIVFLAVLLLALSAAVANFSNGYNSAFKYWLPFIIAVAIPLTGVVIYRCSGTPSRAAYWLLWLLVAILAAYIVWPKVFSSHRNPI